MTVVVRALSATAAICAALLVGATGGVESEYTASALLVVLASGLACGSSMGAVAGILVSAVALG
ncbi:MAG TPA: hypothetical protein VM600_06080, partial [Actinomycetota bacterium]|nr:hypothetical protein [Actinomycetota bacterium]